MTAAAPQAPNALRVAVTWGTTIVALKTLTRGQSFLLGDGPGCALPIPDGVEMSPLPVRANAGGWELDARGCVGGLLTLRGRAEDPAAIAKTSAAVPIMPGDFGLIQYGQVSLFFQYTTQPIAITGRKPTEVLVFLAALCSAILHLGGMGLLSTLSTPLPLPKPPELESADDLARRFKMKRADLEPPPEPPPTEAGDKGVKDPGVQDKKEQGGGRKMKNDEGKLGFNKSHEKTSLPGENRPAQNFGGLSEVLDGDTGKEIKSTLQQISSVSSVLQGLNQKDLVAGGGSGTGLKGSGPGGGGTGAGTLFGGGNMDTGSGAGTGGGGGTGAGGPGGRGTGGNGAGGSSGGAGGGKAPGEAAVNVGAGSAAAKGGLSPERIKQVVMQHLGAVRACYETEAQRNPGLKGGVTVEWQIDPSGAVTRASVASTTLNNPRVEGCVVRQVQRWKFPASDSPTTVAGFPFKFGVGG
ncbi:MAG: AgmX/PglI C-terminal domain-containing protein [Labilithrix sp.]|nr:AgmX/PglI C-terminal domain-containing protein [Labilithrix sp.]MCW5810024.1 AgmX/PglI C-terminal domain-containing protein [Labilithrix sp.]